MPEFRFKKWVDPGKRWALFVEEESGIEFIVPRSRLIPHVVFEYTHPDIKDPNEMVEKAAESNSLFGIPIFRHFIHLMKKGDFKCMDEEEAEKTYRLPPKVDFSCIRDKILAGEDTDEAIADCSSW